MPLATPTRRMPIPEAVRDFFTDLLGKSCAVEKRPEIDFDDPDDDTVYVAGSFVEDDGRLGGACIASLSMAAYCGAALAMIPSAAAEDSITAGELDDGLTENFYEVANIVTALLNSPTVPHLKITTLDPGIPDPIRELLVTAAGRRCYSVTIDEYGTGTLALFAR